MQDSNENSLNLLNFVVQDYHYREPKDLFGALEVFLSKQWGSGPLFAFSLPKEKFHVAGAALRKCRGIWNKKLLLKSMSEANAEKVLSHIISDGAKHGVCEWHENRLVVYGPALDDQYFFAFCDLAKHPEAELLAPLATYVESMLRQISRQMKLDHLQSLVHMDDVTGLYNQRKLLKDLDACIERFHKINEPFAVLFVDIDHFKQVNDGHGHIVGTQLLSEVATVIRGVLRDSDLCYRYGGDEFVVIIPGSNGNEGRVIGERLLRAIRSKNFEIEDIDSKKEAHRLKLSASIGVAGFPEEARSRDEVLAIADKMMYQAKESGRGQVCRAGELFSDS